MKRLDKTEVILIAITIMGCVALYLMWSSLYEKYKDRMENTKVVGVDTRLYEILSYKPPSYANMSVKCVDTNEVFHTVPISRYLCGWKAKLVLGRRIFLQREVRMVYGREQSVFSNVENSLNLK